MNPSSLLIVSVADGERRVGGRVGFGASEGDAMATTTTMATDDDNEGHGYAHGDDDVDGDLVRRCVMVVSMVMNYAWSKEKQSFSLLREKSRRPAFREGGGKNKTDRRIRGIGSENACCRQCRNNACGRTC